MHLTVRARLQTPGKLPVWNGTRKLLQAPLVLETVGSRCKWNPAATQQEVTVDLDGLTWTVLPHTVGPDGSDDKDFRMEARLTDNSGAPLKDCALSWAETPEHARVLKMPVGDMAKCAPGEVAYAQVDTASAYEECQKGVSAARPHGFPIRSTTMCAKMVLQDGAAISVETWVTMTVGCGPCLLKNGFIQTTLASPDNVEEGQTMTLTLNAHGQHRQVDVCLGGVLGTCWTLCMRMASQA